mmetsp:Transcript_1956/g.3520  ORF Transcript_1956/g.3520 Transcript_1956/m.3520 type:complete len:168 (-) Transcript_1956:257-760(-)|eukprot:CAMPEP_0184681400 /NCGR_PEP_ID=MMETSP0312-20130426/4365_1 /TAXON_ID=31354 /ORGANISM="Compsopogon coeruleus, Strain SAG 36.94" /LENGTH=167 /DNA_ID=CAMNT_0027132201 /DNA_START=132 /DNA_END=635 /DNA_ORIENTATION=-
MKVFKDAFTGDEMCSDAMKNVREEQDGLLLVCESYNLSKGGEDYGISNNDEEDGGGAAEGKEQVNVVLDSFQLQEFPMGKKDFQGLVKKLSKRIKDHLEAKGSDRVDKFIESMKTWVPSMLKEFGEYQFYIGRSCDPDAGIVMARYAEGAHHPTFYYFLDGLDVEKF